MTMTLENGHIYELAGERYQAMPSMYIPGASKGYMHLLPSAEGGMILRVDNRGQPGRVVVVEEFVFPESGTEITSDHFVLRKTDYTIADLRHVSGPPVDHPVGDELVPGRLYDLHGTLYMAQDIRFHGLCTNWLADSSVPDPGWHVERSDEQAFGRIAHYLRFVARLDGHLYSYAHPILGDETEYRVADLLLVEK